MDFFQALAGYQPPANVQYQSPGAILRKAEKLSPMMAGMNVDWNNMLAPGYAESMRGFQNTYAPGSSDLMDDVTKGYSDLVGTGYDLPDDIMRSITQRALEAGSRSGLAGLGGLSQAGINRTAATIGLNELDYRRTNLANAGGWVNSMPKYNPQTPMTPRDVVDLELQRQQGQNALEVAEVQRVAMNAASAARMPIQIGSQVIGTILGAAFGTQSIGSGLGVGSGGGGGGFSSILQGMSAGGGGASGDIGTFGMGAMAYPGVG